MKSRFLTFYFCLFPCIIRKFVGVLRYKATKHWFNESKLAYFQTRKRSLLFIQYFKLLFLF